MRVLTFACAFEASSVPNSRIQMRSKAGVLGGQRYPVHASLTPLQVSLRLNRFMSRAVTQLWATSAQFGHIETLFSRHTT